MRTEFASITAVALLWGVVALPAFAQRGMGDPTGVARQTVRPKIVTLKGKMVRVETGPCQNTTGRSNTGTHVVLKTARGKRLIVHLGPAAVVKDVADQLAAGKKVKLEAFRTEKMPENHYVAKSLKFDDTAIQLRDESLRPGWAGGNIDSRGLWRPEWGAGRRRGPQWGRGRGDGWGWGHGPGYGRGYRWGRGPGYGRES
jgi:hypothetical protein